MADSSDPPTPPHQRRSRYRGAHPRHFSEKYKELAPERYPEMTAQVRARGHTPAGQHAPILVEEVVAVLAPRPGDRGVDATCGWGGHSERLLEKLQPGGQLLALDADPTELPRAEARLRRLGFDETTLAVRRTNFAGIRAALDDAGWHDGADFLFADLGVSSMQLDNPARGFSYRADGPLDMRMNPRRGLSASDWLARTSVDALGVALRDDSDEPHATTLAAALGEQSGRLQTTRALADTVRRSLEGRASAEEVELSVRRVFQTLRIEVNDEFGALEALLRQVPECLRPGGRVAFLTFHSGEDRRVKRALDAGERAGWLSGVSRDVVRASGLEQRANPRSRAAKLRSARRRE